MPLFRRTSRPSPPSAEFTVGLRGNRIVVGGPDPGIAQLGELREYVGSVTGHAGAMPDGRDPVAVLNAKMDFAELVDDAASNAALAFEELIERKLIDADEVPPAPDLPSVPRHSKTYEYIQASHARAQSRMEWLESVDVVFRRHGVALLPPAPPDEERR